MGPVQIGRTDAEVAFEFVEAAVDVDARMGRVVGDPNRNRGAPVAIPRDRPVPRTGQPLAELAVLDVLGIPGDLLVQFDHPVAELGDLDEPGRHRPVDQRVAAPPAVRIGVVVGLVADQDRGVHGDRATAALEVPDDLRVRVEDVLPLVIGNGGVEAALGVDRRHRHDAHRVGGGLVILAVGRRHVDDPGAVLGGDEVAAQHLEGVGRVEEIREGRQVAQPQQLLAGQRGQDLRLLAQFPGVGGQACLRQHEPPILHPHKHIRDVGIDRDGLVGRQGPGCGGPDQQVGAVEIGIGSAHPEADGDGRVLAALVDVVVHPQFVAGQRGLVVPAVRQDPDALVGQPGVPELLERPDDRLHERQVEGLVVVVEVHPPRLPGDVGPPFVGVLQHRGAAGVVELLDTHRLDLGLVGDAELPLHLEFGGQAVGVPAEAAFHLVAAHGPVARHDVLDVAGQQVPVVRQPVGEGRPVVEDVLLGAVAALDAGPEGVVGGPVVQDVEFQGGKVR